MSIQYTNSTAYSAASGENNYIVFSHTLGTGANLLVVCIATRNEDEYGPDVIAVYYNSPVPGSLGVFGVKKYYTMAMYVNMYYFVNPSTGANQLYVYFDDTSAHANVLAIDYKGVNTGNPVAGTGVNSGGGTAVTVSVAAAGLTVMTTGIDEQATHTWGSGQNERLDYQTNWSTGDARYNCATGVSDEVGEGSPTATLSVSVNWATAAMSFYARAGASQVICMWSKLLDDLRRGLVPPHELRRRYQGAWAI